MESVWVVKRDRAVEGSSDTMFICKTESTAKNLVGLLREAEKKARKFGVIQSITIGKDPWTVTRGDSFEYDSYPVY